LSGLLAAALLLGAVLRARRAHLAELTDRAARLELERDQQAQIAAVAERTRIAREMHDVIAHSLAVIVALADGAAAKLAKEPERAEAAVQSIADIGREALGDTRRLLGILRADLGNADMAPQPGLQQLDDLMEQLTATGLHATLERQGRPFPLAAAAELTVYRLLQEAGTNTLKHGRNATRFNARLFYAYPSLIVEAVDDGVPVANTTGNPGHGIAGMRERVALYGGTVRSGPEPDGGWRVTASLSAAGGTNGA
jgi:signal transduction histidine kinase